MCSVKILTIFLVVNAVYAGSMRQIVQDVISRTDGVTDKGIHPMDPITLEHLHVTEVPLSTKSHFSDLKVTGFKNVKMSDYNEDGDKVKFTLKFDFTAEGPVRVEFMNKDKSLTGSVKYEGGATGVISYSYTTKKESGKDIYILGTDDVTCESQHAKSTISGDLRTALDNDPDAQAKEGEYEKKYRTEHEAKVVCAITKAVYKKYFENLKVAGSLGGL